INISLSEKGKQIFDSKCLACHNFERRVVGPPLNGITQRRKPEWIMNMIINPEEMTHKDPQAKELLMQYITPMVSQNITEDEARAMLEYFRSKDKGL
ncbi:MAG TPA: cytochrome C, partial [Bacteroidetes bacterium]|nr:cytochrome C [Bacteroidota bacterium]